jgi:hypothetical protein
MKSQFLTLANQWQDLVRGVYSSSSRLTGFSGSFKGMIESTKPQLDSIKSYCDGNAKCKRPGIASFFQYGELKSVADETCEGTNLAQRMTY